MRWCCVYNSFLFTFFHLVASVLSVPFACVRKWLQSWSVLDGTGICMLWMGRSESIIWKGQTIRCCFVQSVLNILVTECVFDRKFFVRLNVKMLFTHYKILCLLTDFQVQISTESLIVMNEHLIKWRSQLNWAQLLFSWHWFNYIPMELVVNDFWIRYLCIRNRLHWTTNPIITRWKCALNSNISVQPAGIEFLLLLFNKSNLFAFHS